MTVIEAAAEEPAGPGCQPSPPPKKAEGISEQRTLLGVNFEFAVIC